MKLKECLIKVSGACLAATVMISSPLTAYAGTGVTYEWHNDGFDAELYRAMYPDVAAAIGNNDTALWEHFKNAGYYEGRVGKMKMPVTTKISVLENGKWFDAARYAADNPDVAAVLGTDRDTLWAHYLANGYNEGRKVHSMTIEGEYRLMMIDVVNSLTANLTTDEEKIRACHDWLVNNLTYGSVPNGTSFGESLFKLGKGVCHQYTEAFEFMMDICGIESQYILGTAGSGGAHSWNRVKVNGVWKYIDCTWDDQSMYGDPTIYYTYYLIPLEQMSIDHKLMTVETYANWTGMTIENQKSMYGLQMFDAQTMVGLDP